MNARRSAEVLAGIGLFAGYITLQVALLGVTTVAGRLRGGCTNCGGYNPSSCIVCRGRA